MKAHKITIKTAVPLKDDPKGLDLAELAENIILSSPPNGASTEQIIKGCTLYQNFMAAKKKNDGAEVWDWWIEKELYATLIAQLDGMRWGSTSGEVRILVAGFIQEIKSSKEQEATITPAAEMEPVEEKAKKVFKTATPAQPV